MAPALAIQKKPEKKVIARQAVTKSNALYHYHATRSSSRNASDGSEENQRRSYLFGLPLIGTYFSLAMSYGSMRPMELVIDMPIIIYEVNNQKLYYQIMLGRPELGHGETCVQWAQKKKLRANTQLVSKFGKQQTMFGEIGRAHV